jgi:hypothetical protein
LARVSIWSLRHILGGSKAEYIIHRLGFDDIRSYYYMALKRRCISYRPRRLTKQSACYYEFGVGWGQTLSRYIEALKAFCHDEGLNPRDCSLCLFDSFEGLPEKKGAEDDNPEWSKGMFSHSIEEIKATIKRHGMNPDSGRFRFIKGFCEEALTASLREELLSIPPDVVTIDVDYYSSTRTVLDWLRPILPSGCLFYFDDIWAFNGNRSQGELKAIDEFNASGQGVLVPFSMVPTLPNICYIYANE